MGRTKALMCQQACSLPACGTRSRRRSGSHGSLPLPALKPLGPPGLSSGPTARVPPRDIWVPPPPSRVTRVAPLGTCQPVLSEAAVGWRHGQESSIARPTRSFRQDGLAARPRSNAALTFDVSGAASFPSDNQPSSAGAGGGSRHTWRRGGGRGGARAVPVKPEPVQLGRAACLQSAYTGLCELPGAGVNAL